MGRYWEVEEWVCKICRGEIELWEHVVGRCSGGERDEKGIGEKLRKIHGG